MINIDGINMKLTIDTTNRTIQVEQICTIEELLTEIKELNIDHSYNLIPTYNFPVWNGYSQVVPLSGQVISVPCTTTSTSKL